MVIGWGDKCHAGKKWAHTLEHRPSTVVSSLQSPCSHWNILRNLIDSSNIEISQLRRSMQVLGIQLMSWELNSSFAKPIWNLGNSIQILGIKVQGGPFKVMGIQFKVLGSHFEFPVSKFYWEFNSTSGKLILSSANWSQILGSQFQILVKLWELD